MKQFLGIGISVGVLAGLWTQISGSLSLVTWVAFVAWACFFAAGGGVTGFRLGLAANLSGVFWGWIVSLVIKHATFDGALAISVAVIAFILCVQASWSVLAFIPGAFCGTACFFGTGFEFWQTAGVMAIGACLGIASEVIGGRIQAMLSGTAPEAAVDPAVRTQPA